MEPLTPITGKSKCTKCSKKISTEEFLKNEHRCKKCNKLPNFIEDKTCKCKHPPHKEECNIPVTRDPVYLCGCMEVTL